MPPLAFSVYQRIPGLVLGFHGCDESVGEAIMRGEEMHLAHSTNDYDWLGRGIYFWENDPVRAWEFANEAATKPFTTKGKIEKPFVLGAVIDLGLCLNLSDRRALDEVADAYMVLQDLHQLTGKPLPVNKGPGFGARYLDCAVIETLHGLRERLDDLEDGEDGLPPYDTVRSAFPEGDLLYENAGFRGKNHIQIAVINQRCIKGYFRPIMDPED